MEVGKSKIHRIKQNTKAVQSFLQLFKGQEEFTRMSISIIRTMETIVFKWKLKNQNLQELTK